jgi:hypothetical protein
MCSITASITVIARRTLGFSHFFLETLTRVALVAPFLRAHPSVRVAVLAALPPYTSPFVAQFLGLLGVAPERIVEVPVCAARVYIPEPTICAAPSLMKALMLQRELWRAVRASVGSEAAAAAASGSRQRGSSSSSSSSDNSSGSESGAWHVRPLRERVVLLINRRGSRRISNFEALHSALRAALEGVYELVVRALPRARACMWRGNAPCTWMQCIFGAMSLRVRASVPSGADMRAILFVENVRLERSVSAETQIFATDHETRVCFPWA